MKNSVTETEIALNGPRATNDRNEGLRRQGLLSLQTALEMETRYKAPGPARRGGGAPQRSCRAACRIGLVSGSSTQRLNVSGPMDGVIIRRPVELGDTVTSEFRASTRDGHRHCRGRRHHDHQGRHQRGGHRQGASRPGSEDLPRCLSQVRFGGKVARIAPAARVEEKVKIFDVEVDVDAGARNCARA